MRQEKSCCCCQHEEAITLYDLNTPWITGETEITKGKIPTITTHLQSGDYLGAIKMRLGIGRKNYKINPGLYAVGNPDADTPVFVSANYKLSFDALRKELTSLDAWIMVIDTKGVNVWCAAGKGTFGTSEIINRIEKTYLSEIVSHRQIILPQLGAPGVSAQEVSKATGFSVVYGPVRSADIKSFLSSGLKATDKMRRVTFTLRERLVLTPLEFFGAAKKSLSFFGLLFLINLIAVRPFGLPDFLLIVGSLFTGTVLMPAMLPIVPGKAFAFKGWLLGLIWTGGFMALNESHFSELLIMSIGYLLLLPSVSAYFAMNFTGSSTFTSLSGVTKEMKIAVPLLAIASIVGSLMILLAAFGL
ncbi:mercury methylation corrinoid protein HgcA [Eubacteriaceae bacterium ES3]|nr:mercury methylation corrinoid protein HgcA [Eubacteriaceae bacterium ES3]